MSWRYSASMRFNLERTAPWADLEEIRASLLASVKASHLYTRYKGLIDSFERGDRPTLPSASTFGGMLLTIVDAFMAVNNISDAHTSNAKDNLWYYFFDAAFWTPVE